MDRVCLATQRPAPTLQRGTCALLCSGFSGHVCMSWWEQWCSNMQLNRHSLWRVCGLRRCRALRRYALWWYRDMLVVSKRLRRVHGSLWRWDLQRHGNLCLLRNGLSLPDANLRRRNVQRSGNVYELCRRLRSLPTSMRRCDVQWHRDMHELCC